MILGPTLHLDFGLKSSTHAGKVDSNDGFSTVSVAGSLTVVSVVVSDSVAFSGVGTVSDEISGGLL